MEKLTNPNMTPMDMIMTMSEGVPGALMVLREMIKSTRGFLDILLCDSLDIRGSKLYILYNYCCDRNIDKFNRTLMMLRCGIFSQEQIHSNLELTKVMPMPFIDDSIKIKGVPPYGKEFGPINAKWEDFCEVQKEAFLKKLNAVLEEQPEKGGQKL